MRGRLQGWVLYLVLTFIWGSAFVLIKLGLRSFEPLELAAIRVLSAATVLIPLAFIGIRNIPRNLWPWLIISGFLGSLLPAFLFGTAQVTIQSGVAGVLSAFTPIWTVVLGIILFKKSIGKWQWVGLAFGFLGSIFLVFQTVSGKLDFSQWQGLLILAATFCYGLNLNIIKYRLSELPSLQIATIPMLFTGPACLAYLLVQNLPNRMADASTSIWESFGFIVLLGVAATGLAIVLFNRLVKSSTPLFASSITYGTSIVAVGFGFLTGETFTLGHLFSILLTIFGIYLIGKE